MNKLIWVGSLISSELLTLFISRYENKQTYLLFARRLGSLNAKTLNRYICSLFFNIQFDFM